MEKDELGPIVSLLAENKLSDEGVENLCKSLNVESIIQIITGVNHYGEKKLWYSEHKVSSIYVGGGHRYRSPRRTVHMNFDRNKKGVWPRAFLYFLLCILREKPVFALDLPLPLPSSSKYFAVLTQKDTTYVTLLKFRKEHVGTMFYAFTTMLYSQRNQKKRLRFNLPELPPLDDTQWD